MSPSVAGAMYIDLANANLKGAYANSIQHFRLEPGQLVLFPSWILHDVKPFEGEGERITVAFNCWFKSQDDAVAHRP
jgi:predicted 2-oxoglutarate/Fe(II)-dependent dioxygenase YbiX